MNTGMKIFLITVAVVGPVPGQTASSYQRDNLGRCLDGIPGCDISALSPQDLPKVAAAYRRRNLESCLKGMSSCDPWRFRSGGGGGEPGRSAT
jgi:hypothetical protein